MMTINWEFLLHLKSQCFQYSIEKLSRNDPICELRDPSGLEFNINKNNSWSVGKMRRLSGEGVFLFFSRWSIFVSSCTPQNPRISTWRPHSSSWCFQVGDAKGEPRTGHRGVGCALCFQGNPRAGVMDPPGCVPVFQDQSQILSPPLSGTPRNFRRSTG